MRGTAGGFEGHRHTAFHVVSTTCGAAAATRLADCSKHIAGRTPGRGAGRVARRTPGRTLPTAASTLQAELHWTWQLRQCSAVTCCRLRVQCVCLSLHLTVLRLSCVCVCVSLQEAVAPAEFPKPGAPLRKHWAPFFAAMLTALQTATAAGAAGNSAATSASLIPTA